MTAPRRSSWRARWLGAPFRVLVVRDAHPVRELRIDPRRIVRVGSWLALLAWLLPVGVLGLYAAHARLERDTMATRVASLTAEATRLSTSIAELERFAGVRAVVPDEGGPVVDVPPSVDAHEVVEATSGFFGVLGRRLAMVTGAVTTRIADLRGTPSGIPIPDARTSSSFGWRPNPFTGEGAEWHAGLDLPAPEGTPVTATADGVVESVGANGGYGLAVVVRNRQDYTTIYGHLRDVAVRAGQEIARGTVVGHVGNTGRSTGPHVHYEVRRNGRAVNPKTIRPPELPASSTQGQD